MKKEIEGVSQIHRTWMNRDEKKKSLEVRVDMLDAEVSGMKRAMAEQGELMRALMERAEMAAAAHAERIGVHWPETALLAIAGGSASPSILRRPRASGGAE